MGFVGVHGLMARIALAVAVALLSAGLLVPAAAAQATDTPGAPVAREGAPAALGADEVPAPSRDHRHGGPLADISVEALESAFEQQDSSPDADWATASTASATTVAPDASQLVLRLGAQIAPATPIRDASRARGPPV